ncbi:MAG: GvpL/GvpF family gas vesicle protein [Pseudomonadota bacterium]
MEQWQLVCVTPQNTETIHGVLGDVWEKYSLQRVCEGELTALLRPYKKTKNLLPFHKKKQLQDLVAWQKLLEHCLDFKTLIPGSGNAILNDLGEASTLLKSNDTKLTQALQDFGNLVQYQITIFWDPKAVLKARQHDDSTFSEVVTAQHSKEDKVKFGQMLQSKMEAYKIKQAECFVGLLEAQGIDLIKMPCDAADMILNAVVLIDPQCEPKLYSAVESIDQNMPGQLNIKYVGPLPPISFASVTIGRASQSDIASACKLLNLKLPCNAEQVRVAYLEYMKTHHPDVSATLPNKVVNKKQDDHISRVQAAYKLLTRIVKADADFLQNRGTLKHKVLLDIQRESELQKAA